MNHDRTKRLGMILESANQLEASQQRRKRVSLMMWGFLIFLILVGTFFAGRVWYSRLEVPNELSAESAPLRSASSQAAGVTLPASGSTAQP